MVNFRDIFSPIIASQIAILAMLSIGCYIFLNNRGHIVNRTFALLMLSMSTWVLGQDLGALTPYDSPFYRYITLCLYIGAIFNLPFYLHFVLSFLDKHKEKSKIIIGVYIGAAILLIALFTELLVVLDPPGSFAGPRGLLFTPLYYLFFVPLYAFSGGYGIYMLWRCRRAFTGVKRYQTKLFLIASGIGWVGATVSYLLLLDIYIFPVWDITNILVAAIFGYAIARYRFLDVDVHLSRDMLWIFISVLTGLCYPFLVWGSIIKLRNLNIHLLPPGVSASFSFLTTAGCGTAVILFLSLIVIKELRRIDVLEENLRRNLIFFTAGIAHSFKKESMEYSSCCRQLATECASNQELLRHIKYIDDTTQYRGRFFQFMVNFAQRLLRPDATKRRQYLELRTGEDVDAVVKEIFNLVKRSSLHRGQKWKQIRPRVEVKDWRPGRILERPAFEFITYEFISNAIEASSDKPDSEVEIYVASKEEDGVRYASFRFINNLMLINVDRGRCSNTKCNNGEGTRFIYSRAQDIGPLCNHCLGNFVKEYITSAWQAEREDSHSNGTGLGLFLIKLFVEECFGGKVNCGLVDEDWTSSHKVYFEFKIPEGENGYLVSATG